MSVAQVAGYAQHEARRHERQRDPSGPARPRRRCCPSSAAAESAATDSVACCFAMPTHTTANMAKNAYPTVNSGSARRVVRSAPPASDMTRARRATDCSQRTGSTDRASRPGWPSKTAPEKPTTPWTTRRMPGQSRWPVPRTATEWDDSEPVRKPRGSGTAIRCSGRMSKTEYTTLCRFGRSHELVPWA